MRFEEKTVSLKDGRRVTLKSAEPKDAQKMIDYMRLAFSETDFLLRNPDEVTFTLEQEEGILQGMLENPRAMMLCAMAEGRVVAAANLGPVGSLRKVRHRANLGISVLKAFWGQGLGSLLMQEIILSARAMGYLQLGLQVAADNARAIRLYERCGFVRVGCIPQAFRLDNGQYQDEALMEIRL